MPFSRALHEYADIAPENFVATETREQESGSVSPATACPRDVPRSLWRAYRSTVNDEGIAKHRPAFTRRHTHRDESQHLAECVQVGTIVALSREVKVDRLDAACRAPRNRDGRCQKSAGVDSAAHEHAHAVHSLDGSRDRRENVVSQLVGQLVDRGHPMREHV
jgi:hypothetical protein